MDFRDQSIYCPHFFGGKAFFKVGGRGGGRVFFKLDIEGEGGIFDDEILMGKFFLVTISSIYI